MGYIVQHLSRIIIPPVVILLLAFGFYNYRNPLANEQAMIKELEYVINQQAEEIAKLKSEIETKAPPPQVVEKAIRIDTHKACPVPLKPENLPCTIKDPAAIIAIRGYKD